MLHLHRAFPRLCCIILDPDLDLNLDPLSFIIFSTFCFTTNDALLYFYECRISGLVFVLFVCLLPPLLHGPRCLLDHGVGGCLLSLRTPILISLAIHLPCFHFFLSFKPTPNQTLCRVRVHLSIIPDYSRFGDRR